MKNIFVDTNIIIDFISNRIPFGDHARNIFKLAEENRIRIYCNSHSIATTHYILRKVYPETTVREKITELLDFMSVIAVDEEILKKALKSMHKDFEDAVQIFSAHQIKNMSTIVTRNLKDFSTSEIPVMAPDEFLKLFK